MQLKRDTEYALRILHCLTISGEEKKYSAMGLGRETQVPAVIVKRLCEMLAGSQLIASMSDPHGNRVYYVTGENLSRSLWDVMETVENQTGIFAVFDRESRMYEQCGERLRNTDREFRTAFSSITIRELMLGPKEKTEGKRQ